MAEARAHARAQSKWRAKHRYVKTQLNVMARRQVHRCLDEIAAGHGLSGKGEAVAFATFVVKAIEQRAGFSPQAARMLDDFAAAYRRNRDLYTA